MITVIKNGKMVFEGRIEEDLDADIAIFDENINITHTIVGGKTVYEA